MKKSSCFSMGILVGFIATLWIQSEFDYRKHVSEETKYAAVIAACTEKEQVAFAQGLEEGLIKGQRIAMERCRDEIELVLHEAYERGRSVEREACRRAIAKARAECDSVLQRENAEFESILSEHIEQLNRIHYYDMENEQWKRVQLEQELHECKNASWWEALSQAGGAHQGKLKALAMIVIGFMTALTFLRNHFMD